MNRAESNGELVREASELTAGVDASVVLSALTQEGYDDEIEALSKIEHIERTAYNMELSTSARPPPSRPAATYVPRRETKKPDGEGALGDTTRTVLLNFDRRVVVTTE